MFWRIPWRKRQNKQLQRYEWSVDNLFKFEKKNVTEPMNYLSIKGNGFELRNCVGTKDNYKYYVYFTLSQFLIIQ